MQKTPATLLFLAFLTACGGTTEKSAADHAKPDVHGDAEGEVAPAKTAKPAATPNPDADGEDADEEE